MSKFVPGLIVALIAILAILNTSCGSRSSGPTPSPNCQADGCVNWSHARALFCQQYTSTPNEAFQATPRNSAYTLPIYIFYQVIQTNAAGVSNPPLAEQQWLIPSSQGSMLPVCQAAQLGTTEIYTQTLRVNCATNRALGSGSTSANCTAAERSVLIVKSFSGDFTREAASRMAHKLQPLNAFLLNEAEAKEQNVEGQPSSPKTSWAPSALSPGASVDCTSVCDNESGICIHVSSTELSIRLLNLVNSWKPGTAIDKAAATAALGVTDQCDRSSSVIDAKGRISNTGTKPCAVPMDFEGQPVMVDVPHEVAGRSAIGANNRQIDFLASKELQLDLPDDLQLYGGPILYVSEPTGRRVIDLRTPTACVRVHEH